MRDLQVSLHFNEETPEESLKHWVDSIVMSCLIAGISISVKIDGVEQVVVVDLVEPPEPGGSVH